MGNDHPHTKTPNKTKSLSKSQSHEPKATSIIPETLKKPNEIIKTKNYSTNLSLSTRPSPNRGFQPKAFTRSNIFFIELLTIKLKGNSNSIKDKENQVNLTIFRSKDGQITEERLCLKILLTETIENMKQELNKKFHLGSDLDSLLYDLKAVNSNERKVESPANICEKSKIEIFGKSPNFIISSKFSFKFSSPLEQKITLKKSLCVEINEIKEHFSKEYDVPKEEIILICKKSPKTELLQGFLLDYQIERSNGNELFLEKKHGEPSPFIIDFKTKIELKLRFNSSEEIYKVSSFFTIKTLKKKLAGRFLAEEYENQIWTLTFPDERKEILKDDCELATLKLPKIEITISKISRNELDFQDTMKETLIKYPSGMEKDILNLYFDLNLEKMTKFDFEKISEKLKEIEKTIIHNSPYAEIFRDYFKELYLILESRDPVILKKEIIKMFEKIDPINLESLNRKLKISEKEARNMISDERIFILLGTSGVGKSTTACYLSKCNMVKEDGNIIVKPGTLPPAPCKIGRSIHSETRGFHPFLVSLKEYKGLSEKRMILCDTAGFKDTEGPDLDLLNSLSITRSIEYASEVKPIVIISESSCGARFEGVKALAGYLLKMIPSTYYLLSCDYFFTKVSIFDEITIRKKIDSLCEDLEKESPERNKDLIKILKDMKEKVKILDPIEKKPQIEEIISSWMNSQFIPKHEEMFRNSFSFETIEIVRKQIEIIKKALIYYVRINGYEMVDFKLRQLKKISKLLPYQFKEVYMEGIKVVSNFLNESLMTEINSLISKMTKIEEPTQEEIQSAFKLKRFELWGNVRKKHLKNELYNRDFITEYFMEEMQKISNSFQQLENFSEKEPTNFLRNIYVISIEFPDFPEFGKFTKTNIEIFHQDIKNSIDSFEPLLEKNQLNIIATSLSDIGNALMNIPEKHQKLNLYEEAKNEVIEYYENFENPIGDEEDDDEQVLNYVAEKERFQRLIIRLKKLEVVENAKELHQHIPKTVFLEMKTYVCKKISVFLDKIKRSIIENKNYNEINKILHDMNDILVFADEIKQSSETVSKMIKSTFKQLKHFIIRVQNDVSEVLNDLHQKKEKIDYNKLNKALDCLIVNKDLINKIIPGANYTFTEIDEEIDCYFADKKDEFDQIDLHYRNHQGLPEIKELLISLSKIRRYDKLFEKVKKYFDAIMEEFKRWIKSNFRKIKREKEKEFESHDFGALEMMFLYLKSLDGLLKNKLVNNYLPELEFNVEEELNEFLSDIKQKIKNFKENFLDEKKQSLEFSVRNLAKVEECSKLCNLSKEFNLEKIYQDLIKKLTIKYNNLKIELLDAHELENFTEIFAKLNECKLFVDFDHFLDKNYRFQELYVDQDAKLRELLAKLVKRAETCIQKNDFQSLLEIFEKFNFEPPKMKQLYNIILKNKETIRNSMKTHFRFLKEKIEMWFETNSNTFPENSELNLIYPDLKILKEGYTDLLNYDPDLKKNWDFSIDSFFNIFTSRLKIIENEMNANKFSLFEQHLKDFKYAMTYLRKLDQKKAEEIGKKIDNLENSRTQVLNVFLEQVRIINLESLDIEYSPPKERYDELRTLSGDLHQYQNSFRDYSKILVEKIQERIELIKKADHEEQRGKFLKMKEWLKFMPDILSNHFLEKVEENLQK